MKNSWSYNNSQFFCDFSRDNRTLYLHKRKLGSGSSNVMIEFHFQDDKINFWYEVKKYANNDCDTKNESVDINDIGTSSSPDRPISGKQLQFYTFVNEVIKWYLDNEKLLDKKLKTDLEIVYNANFQTIQQAQQQGAYNGYHGVKKDTTTAVYS